MSQHVSRCVRFDLAYRTSKKYELINLKTSLNGATHLTLFQSDTMCPSMELYSRNFKAPLHVVRRISGYPSISGAKITPSRRSTTAAEKMKACLMLDGTAVINRIFSIDSP